LGLLVAGAEPAAADPPQPTDYRSTVGEIDPDVDGVRAEIVGGDAFLELTVDEGTEVTVEGYSGEPYLRFGADGTVEHNTRSTATYLNEDRDGAVELPAQADDTAEPVWEQVATGGTFAWHDHRIHWMGGSRPPGVRPGDVVQSWTVPIAVDGTPVDVRGTLVLVDGVNPLPWLVLTVVGAAAVVVLARRWPWAPAAGVLLGAGAALTAGWGEYPTAPAGSGANPLLLAVPLVGLLAAAVGLAVTLTARNGGEGPARGLVGTAATLAGAAAVVGWALLRLEVLWTPVLPTDLPAGADRALTALALGLSAGGAVVVAWTGGRTRTMPSSPGEGESPSDDGIERATG
jgi:hypothetical protein